MSGYRVVIIRLSLDPTNTFPFRINVGQAQSAKVFCVVQYENNSSLPITEAFSSHCHIHCDCRRVLYFIVLHLLTAHGDGKIKEKKAIQLN